MSTRNLFLASAIAAAALASCTGELSPEVLISQDSARELSLKLGIEGHEEDTRTFVQSGGKVVWNYNEESISVFTAPGTHWQFTKKPGSGPTAEFTGVISGSSPAYVAVYPYSEFNDMQSGSSVPGYADYDYCITATLPLLQEYYEGSFSMDTYPMAAAAASNTFTMYGLAGGLVLPVKEDGTVKYAVVRGNAGERLSGQLTAGLSLTDPVPGNIQVKDGSDKVILCDPWRGTALPGGPWSKYHVVLAPLTFTKGFTVFYVKTDGTIARATTDKEVTIKRATFAIVSNLNEKMEAPVSVEPVDLGLSVKWSPCDLGTLDPWDTGLSFAWGKTELWNYSGSDYSAPLSDVMTISDDAANTILGGEWRTPTKEEFQELLDYCDWAKTDEGWKVTSKANGNSITLPDAPHWTATKGYEFKDRSVSACDALYAKKFIRPVNAPSEIINFADKTLEAVLVSSFDTSGDGRLSANELAVVDYNALFGVSWGDKSRFTSFKEFRYFTGLSSIPDYLFSGWTSLVSIVFPSSVEELPNSLCEDCTSLTDIEIPPTLKSVGGFSGCTSIKSIVLPEGVERISFNAFMNCSNLKSITLPGTLQKIEASAFWNCYGMSEFYVPSLEAWMNVELGMEAHPFSYSHEPETHMYVAGTELTKLVVPSAYTSIKPIQFYFCRGITSVTLHDGITEIGKEAFCLCTSLTELKLGKGLKTIREAAFRSCFGLTSLTLPEGLTSIGDNAFSTCYNLQSLTIPSTLTQIGSYAFNNCSSLSHVYLASLSSWLAADIGYSGVPWTSLGEETPLHLYISGVETTSINVPEGTKAIGNYAFSTCNSITSVTVPSSVKSIGTDAFHNCPHLESVSLAEGVESIGNAAFSGCTSLLAIDLPSSLKSLGNGALNRCAALSTLVIPENVTSIGNYAFSYATGLTSLELRPVTPPEAGEDLLLGVPQIPVYVPAGSVSAYKSASGWKTYASWFSAR